jgi:hypothetical protein
MDGPSEEAIKYYDQAVKNKPNYLNAYLKKIFLLKRDKRYQ